MVELVALMTVAANAWLRILVSVARRPLLLAATVFAFVVCAIAALILSAAVFHGWWQQFFLDAGVSLLFVGVIELAILGALRRLLEAPAPEGSALDADAIRKLLEAPGGSALDEPDHGLSEVLAVVQRIELRLEEQASSTSRQRNPDITPTS